MMLFSRRKVAQVNSLQELLRIQEALAAQGIASSAGAGGYGPRHGTAEPPGRMFRTGYILYALCSQKQL